MRVWALDCNVNTYENLTMVGEFDLELSLSFDGRRKLPTWEPLAVKRMDRRRFSNTPGFASHIPVFDRRAVDALAGLMGDYVEVLPLACADGEFYAINVVEVLDCIDYERSQFLRFADSQRIMLFEKYEFIEHIVDGKPIFKIADERLRRPFVSDAFRQTVMQNNFTGFVFELAWDSEDRNG